MKHGHPAVLAVTGSPRSRRGCVVVAKTRRASLTGSFEPTVLGPAAVESSDLARRAAVARPRVVEPGQHRRVARPWVRAPAIRAAVARRAMFS